MTGWSNKPLDVGGVALTEQMLRDTLDSIREQKPIQLPTCAKCGRSMIHPTPGCDNEEGVVTWARYGRLKLVKDIPLHHGKNRRKK